MKVLLVLLFAITLSVCHGFVRDIVRGLTTCSDSQQSKSPVTGIEQSCLDDADRGMCQFYDCFERRYPCDTCGFAKEYGKNVCEKFQQPNINDGFDDAGKRWANATNRCLLVTMKELYQRQSVRCDETISTMLDQVSICFLRNDSGVRFCDIAAANREILTRVFMARNFIQSRRVRTEILKLKRSCSGQNPGANLKSLRSRIRGRILNATSSRQ